MLESDKPEQRIEVCKHLRWKGSQQLRNNPAQLRAALERNEVPYSCLRTFQTWGPDGQLVAPEKCKGSRACFRSSPHMLLSVKK
jgi:hypothetical protein